MTETVRLYKKKKKRRIGQRILVTVGIVLGVLIILLTGVEIMRINYNKNYHAASTPAFEIPGIHKGFVSQGLSYDPATDDFFLCGYMASHMKASPIYIVDRATGTCKKRIRMAKPDGKPFLGHAGGIAVLGDTAYVAGSNDCCVYAFDVAELENAPEDSYVSYKYKVNMKTADDNIRVSFVATDGNLLYAGEFYKFALYETNGSHLLKTASGRQKAFIVGFELGENGEATPVKVFSIPGNVQGACFDGDKIYLSASSTLSYSDLYCYDLSTIEQSGTYNVLGKDLPLYILDKTKLYGDYRVLPMSEEIDIVDGKIYINCEAASNKYLIGKLSGADVLKATDISILESLSAK